MMRERDADIIAEARLPSFVWRSLVTVPMSILVLVRCRVRHHTRYVRAPGSGRLSIHSTIV